MVSKVIVFSALIPILCIYIKKNWSDLVDNGLVGKSLGVAENDYDDSGIFYASFVAPRINYCFVIGDFGVILAKKPSTVVAKKLK